MNPQDQLASFSAKHSRLRKTAGDAKSLLEAYGFAAKAKNPQHFSHQVQTGISVKLPLAGVLDVETWKAVINVCKQIQLLPARLSKVEEHDTTFTVTLDAKLPELRQYLTFTPHQLKPEREALIAQAKEKAAPTAEDHERNYAYMKGFYKIYASRSGDMLHLSAPDCEGRKASFRYTDATPAMVMQFAINFTDEVATILNARKGLLSKYETLLRKYTYPDAKIIEREDNILTIKDTVIDGKVLTLETYGDGYPNATAAKDLQAAVDAIRQVEAAVDRPNFTSRIKPRTPVEPHPGKAGGQLQDGVVSRRVVFQSGNISSIVKAAKASLFNAFKQASGISGDAELLKLLSAKMKVSPAIIDQYFNPEHIAIPPMATVSKIAILRKKQHDTLADLLGKTPGKTVILNQANEDFSTIADSRNRDVKGVAQPAARTRGSV